MQVTKIKHLKIKHDKKSTVKISRSTVIAQIVMKSNACALVSSFFNTHTVCILSSICWLDQNIKYVDNIPAHIHEVKLFSPKHTLMRWSTVYCDSVHIRLYACTTPGTS